MNYDKIERKKIKIYIAAHKRVDTPDLEGYKVIEVGSLLHEDHFSECCDDMGDNISVKNKTFCELTAYYWMWKNSNADIVGLVHYRRFFSKKRIDDNEKYYLNKKQIVEILRKNDVILPEPIYWKNYTVATGYDHGAGHIKDLDVIRKIIIEDCPGYLAVWDKVVNGKKASYCNMFVMSKRFFDDYCIWLFDILFKAEKMIDLSGYSDDEKRIFGFLSEILLNVWVLYNKLKVYHMPIVKLEEKKRKTLRILKYVEKIPGMGCFVRMGLVFDFNKRQH